MTMMCSSMRMTHPDYDVQQYEDVEYLTDHHNGTHDAEHCVHVERGDKGHRDDSTTCGNLKHILDVSEI